jgi:hypothetical protein
LNRRQRRVGDGAGRQTQVEIGIVRRLHALIIFLRDLRPPRIRIARVAQAILDRRVGIQCNASFKRLKYTPAIVGPAHAGFALDDGARCVITTCGPRLADRRAFAA